MQKELILSRGLLAIYDVFCTSVQILELFPTLFDLFVLLATEEPNLEERKGRGKGGRKEGKKEGKKGRGKGGREEGGRRERGGRV